MKTSLLKRIAILSLLMSAFVSQQSIGQSQVEMNKEAAKEFAAVDAELNKVYGELIRSMDDKGEIKALREAQRAWLEFVELHLKQKFFVKEGENPRVRYGSIYPLEFLGEKKRLFKLRINDLKQR